MWQSLIYCFVRYTPKFLFWTVKSVKDKAGFYAEQLHDCMDGMGTRDRALIRIVTLRSEIDMEDIKRAFSQKYGQSLADFIKVQYPQCFKTFFQSKS